MLLLGLLESKALSHPIEGIVFETRSSTQEVISILISEKLNFFVGKWELLAVV